LVSITVKFEYVSRSARFVAGFPTVTSAANAIPVGKAERSTPIASIFFDARQTDLRPLKPVCRMASAATQIIDKGIRLMATSPMVTFLWQPSVNVAHGHSIDVTMRNLA
jgi:hypothetical protein